MILPVAQVDELFRKTESTPGYELTVDLPEQTVTDASGLRFPFEVNAFRKHSLLEGLDEIGLTLKHTDAISAFEKSHHPAAAQTSGAVDFKDFIHVKN